jgi:hypothetical protein
MPIPIAAAVGAAARVVGPSVISATTRAARSKVGKRVIQGMAFKAGMNAVSGSSNQLSSAPASSGIVTEYSQY